MRPVPPLQRDLRVTRMVLVWSGNLLVKWIQAASIAKSDAIYYPNCHSMAIKVTHFTPCYLIQACGANCRPTQHLYELRSQAEFPTRPRHRSWKIESLCPECSEVASEPALPRNTSKTHAFRQGQERGSTNISLVYTTPHAQVELHPT